MIPYRQKTFQRTETLENFALYFITFNETREYEKVINNFFK